ncbi:MAG: hypothetical protein AAFN51_08670 [Pseudomonadota bacterium]
MLVAVIPSPAFADVQSNCTQTEDWWLRIEACTQAIESPRWSGAAGAWAYSNRAVAHAELGNYLSAFDDHEKAVMLNPSDAAARNNKGISHALFREYDRAIREYSAAIQLRAGYTNAFFNRADTYLAMGEYALAVEDYTTVIAGNAEAADAFAGRSEASCQLGDTDRSAEDRLQALRLGVPEVSDMADYLTEKGYLGSATGDIEQIAPALREWTNAGCP